MKKIALFTTGGTISSIYDPIKKVITPALSGEELLAFIRPHLSEGNIEVELFEKGINPGPHLTPEYGHSLSQEIKNVLSREEIYGAVIVQGTDSLDEMSYLTSLLVLSDKPVIFTGAMKSSKELYMDVMGNLIGAIEIAADKKSKGKGVLVYFDEGIHAARDVEKYHANKIDAFISPQGTLGQVLSGIIYYHHTPVKDFVFNPKTMNCKVGLIKVCTGMDDIFIRACIDNKYEGIVIEGFGAGNVPPTIYDAIQAAIAEGLIVVIVTRCHDGRAIPVYNYKGGGVSLDRLGVIWGGDLSGQKARIKLMVMLGSGLSKTSIKEEF